jgi:hypothetical protein
MVFLYCGEKPARRIRSPKKQRAQNRKAHTHQRSPQGFSMAYLLRLQTVSRPQH